MADLEYAHRIISDAVESDHHRKAKKVSGIESTHVFSVDGSRLDDFFYADGAWIWKAASDETIDEPHVHDFPEVIGFVGGNREDPHDLNGEISVWLNGEETVLTRSALIFVPAGTVHGPVRFTRVDGPVFFVTVAPTNHYSRKPASEGVPGQKCTVIDKTKERFSVGASGTGAPAIKRDPSLRSTRILHIEDDMVPGAFYIDFVWIWEGNGGAPAPEHVHDWEELIAMTGSDPSDPHALGGQMSIVLGGETHVMDNSSLVCIPRGTKHCPWKFIGIKKPTLIFSASPASMYSGSHKTD